MPARRASSPTRSSSLRFASPLAAIRGRYSLTSREGQGPEGSAGTSPAWAVGAKRDGALTMEEIMSRPIYRLHHELRRGSLYVVVDPPLVAADPVSLSLAGVRPESRALLQQLVRGDEIPGGI